MSVVQNVEGWCTGQGKLGLRWEIFTECVGLLVELAGTPDMKTNFRQCLLPVVAGCELDCGPGNWWVRVGCLIGDKKSGKVEMSGVYGPFGVQSAKGLMPIGASSGLKVIYTQALQDGMRFHTGHLGELWALIETYDDGKRLLEYVYDWGRGYVDCVGLASGRAYNFRLWLFLESVAVEGKVEVLGAGISVAGKKTLGRTRFISATESTVAKADKAIMKDLAGSKRVQFADYRQYAAYLAAKERTQGQVKAL